MTPVKTCFLLLLSVLFIAPTVSEVVMSMSDCKGFLLNNKPPQVPDVVEDDKIQDNNRYKVICQTYKDERRFVTLYDTKNKIPVFSAYKFTKPDTGRPDDLWKMEPQLEDMGTDKNMEDNDINVEYNNQAGDKDYKEGTAYDKGHLLPSSYAKSQDDKTSTSTLTNAVPQVRSFNRGSWARMEKCVKCVMEKFCVNSNKVIEGYVITGAKPGNSEPVNRRVNVPSLLWSAFCCYSNNKWIASAYWGENVKDGADDTILPTNTLTQLYDQLKDGDKRFEAFPGSSCPLVETVDDLYSQVKNDCYCVKKTKS
ncbi:endonuclease domain-containing 1 protein-like isoform X2 [Betta splendens]|nr:endonuclease domain-containing 1 protein-like isoform X2 [Betta splendens]